MIRVKMRFDITLKSHLSVNLIRKLTQNTSGGENRHNSQTLHDPAVYLKSRHICLSIWIHHETTVLVY